MRYNVPRRWEDVVCLCKIGISALNLGTAVPELEVLLVGRNL
jgi:hypothetical protein